MKHAKTMEYIVPVVIATYAVYYLVDTDGYPLEVVMFGWIFGGILLIGAVLQLIIATFRSQSPVPSQTETSQRYDGLGLQEITPRDRPVFHAKAVGLFVSIALYILLIPRLGYIPSTMGMCLIVMFISGTRNIRSLLSVTVGVGLISYVLFVEILQIPFSAWPVLTSGGG